MLRLQWQVPTRANNTAEGHYSFNASTSAARSGSGCLQIIVLNKYYLSTQRVTHCVAHMIPVSIAEGTTARTSTWSLSWRMMSSACPCHAFRRVWERTHTPTAEYLNARHGARSYTHSGVETTLWIPSTLWMVSLTTVMKVHSVMKDVQPST